MRGRKGRRRRDEGRRDTRRKRWGRWEGSIGEELWMWRWEGIVGEGKVDEG